MPVVKTHFRSAHGGHGNTLNKWGPSMSVPFGVGVSGLVWSQVSPIVVERASRLDGLVDQSILDTSESVPALDKSLAVARLPTDPVYLFNLTLNNIQVGSLYVVTRADNGDSLAIGTTTTDPTVITGLPAFGSSMLMDISIRKGTSAPFYKIFDTAAYSAIAGTSVYVLQQPE